MSVQIIQAIADEFARRGGTVVYRDGWKTRGNGQSSAYKGGLFHHTAGGNNIYIDEILVTGRWDLAGPLCNFCIMYDGDLGVIAANPANHAGASGGWDTAPFPRTGLFNKEIIGTEIQYKGTEPMADVQYKSATLLASCILSVLNKAGKTEWIKFHQGTSIEGKWDPGYDARGYTYDIGKFRKDVLALDAVKEILDMEDRVVKTRNGDRKISDMIVEMYNEVCFPGYESLADKRNKVPAEKIFKGSPVTYLLEVNAKMEEVDDKLDKITALLSDGK